MRATRLVTMALALSVVLPSVSGSTSAQADEELPSEAAAEAAESEDRRVEIESARTETSTLFANPDGTFTRDISAEPIRTQVDGTWKPVDYTLARNADGSVSPEAAPFDVSLSGGGDGSLTSQSFGDTELRTEWSKPLPRPVLDGATAIYPEVYEGVDLAMTVSAGGVTQVLIVKNRDAAQNKDLSSVEIRTAVSGGELLQLDGGFEIRDATDRQVAVATRPVMWDSTGTVTLSGGGVASDQSADAIEVRRESPVAGDVLSAIPTAYEGDSLTLEPSADALKGDDVTYPLYIDPKTTPMTRSRWAMAFEQHRTLSDYKWTDGNGQGVGHQTYNGISTKRLFWWFSYPSMRDADVSKAVFTAKMVWSASCSPTTTNLYRVASFGSDLSWAKQPRWSTFQDSVKAAVGRSDCTPAGRNYEWDVRQAAQSASNSGSAYLAFGMRALDEGNPQSWKRFLHSATLSVTYNRAPSTASSLKIDSIPCYSDAAKTEEIGSRIAQPRLSAKATDPDGDRFKVVFEYWGTGISYDNRKKATGLGDKSGGTSKTSQISLPRNSAGSLASGSYTVQGQTYDEAGLRAKNWSAPCKFTIDANAPGSPILSPPEDAPEQWRQGQPLPVTVEPSGTVSDVDGYKWSLNKDVPVSSRAVTAADRVTTISVTPPTQGVHTLRVWAYDGAGNLSKPSVLHFETNDFHDESRSRFTFNADASTSIADEGDVAAKHPLLLPNTQLLTLRGRWFDELATEQRDLMFLTPGGGDVARSDRVLASDKSFIVAGWLDPTLPEEEELS